MALAYVSVTELKDHLLIQHSAMDAKLSLMIEAASNAIKNYLKDFSGYEAQRTTDDDDYILDSNLEPKIQPDSDGDRVVKAEVKLAVIEYVRTTIENPELMVGLEQGRLPGHVESLLYQIRDPALK